jgi:hypothetical protein
MLRRSTAGDALPPANRAADQYVGRIGNRQRQALEHAHDRRLERRRLRGRGREQQCGQSDLGVFQEILEFSAPNWSAFIRNVATICAKVCGGLFWR